MAPRTIAAREYAACWRAIARARRALAKGQMLIADGYRAWGLAQAADFIQAVQDAAAARERARMARRAARMRPMPPAPIFRPIRGTFVARLAPQRGQAS
jgi:hypothetical protein